MTSIEEFMIAGAFDLSSLVGRLASAMSEARLRSRTKAARSLNTVGNALQKAAFSEGSVPYAQAVLAQCGFIGFAPEVKSLGVEAFKAAWTDAIRLNIGFYGTMH